MLYHLAVLLVETEVSPQDVEAVLIERQGKISKNNRQKRNHQLLVNLGELIEEINIFDFPLLPVNQYV